MAITTYTGSHSTNICEPKKQKLNYEVAITPSTVYLYNYPTPTQRVKRRPTSINPSNIYVSGVSTFLATCSLVWFRMG